MPQITGIDHIAITVTNMEVSVAFYQLLFGVSPSGRLAGPNLERTVFRLPDDTTIGLTQHERGAPHGFSAYAPGLDHLGLGVATFGELELWLEHLTQAGIDNSGIVMADYGTAISFLDPDGTPFDLFVRRSSASD